MGRSERGGLSIYSSKDSHVKITVEHRGTMRALIENGLRHELGVPNIRWITVVGGLARVGHGPSKLKEGL